MNTEADVILTDDESFKRNQLKTEKPYVYEKIMNYEEKVKNGESIAILQFQYDYQCNFECVHCSADDFMLKTKEERAKYKDKRTFTIDDVKELSRQGDEMGLAHIVITGGEPLTYPDFDKVVEAIDPKKWYIVSDTNGWFLDEARAEHLKKIGVDKVQISLDSLNAEEHDKFRRKPGSHARVMRAIDSALNAGLNIILSTCVWKSRVKSKELEEFLAWSTQKGIGVYITLAKPVGSFSGQLDEVCDSEDIIYIDNLEKKYNCFTHWTPGYGLDVGCIAMKKMVSISKYGDIMPCPYTHVSMGNVFKEPLKDIINRGLQLKLFSYDKKETCFIGNIDHEYIHKYLPRYQDKYNEVDAAPYTEVFTAEDFSDGKMIWSPSFIK